MKNFIVFDSISSPIQTKSKFLNLLRTENLYIFNSSSLYDGNGIFKLRQLLNNLDPENTLSFIWNGSELGCDLFIRNVYQFGIKFIFIEQGILPQNQNLRLINTTVWQEKYMGINLENVNNIDYEINSGEGVKKKKKKICLAFQLSHDSSLLKLRNPLTEIPKLFSRFINSLSDEYEIFVCPHPANKNDISKYDMKPLGQYKVSKLSTIEEASDASFLVAFNSTVLYEAFLKDIPVIALDVNHILNAYSTKNAIYSAIQHCQFDPCKISIEELLIKVKRL